MRTIALQEGKTAVVTGTGGLGFETALALAGAGANVILAGRNATKGDASVAAIRAQNGHANIHFSQLDLASLESVEAFATRTSNEVDAVDILVNNAGVMALPKRQETHDGFEMQLGTNYLGHFALTARLVPLLKKAPAPRVVNLSSVMARAGKFDFSDLQLRDHYSPQRAYGNSKLAMLIFSLELHRRARAQEWNIQCMAAHPGYARTELVANGPGADSPLIRWGEKLVGPWLSQSAADGALAQLMGATDPTAESGAYYGPSGPFQLKGPPVQIPIPTLALDGTVAQQLWTASEKLVGLQLS